MSIFRIRDSVTCYHDHYVEAPTEDDAIEKWSRGEYVDEMEDYFGDIFSDDYAIEEIEEIDE